MYQPGSWKFGPNYYVAVLQAQGPDGTWSDLAKTSARGFSSGTSQLQTLEVEAQVKPGTIVRLELRVGDPKASRAEIMVKSARLFFPICFTLDAASGECL